MKKIRFVTTILTNTKYLFNQVGKFGRKSLFVRNFAVFAGCLIVLLIFNGINFYKTVQDNINAELENNNRHILGRIEDMGTSVLKTAETIAANIAVQSFTKQYVVSADESSIKNYEEEVADFIKMYTLVYDYVDSIYVVSTDYDRMTIGNGNVPVKNFDDLKFLDKLGDIKTVLTVPRDKKGVYPQLITIVRPITIYGTLESVEEHNSVIGLVCINIKTRSLGEVLNSVENGDNDYAQVFIIDENKKVLFSPEPRYTGKDIADIEMFGKLRFDTDGYSYRTKNEGESVIVSSLPSTYAGHVFVSVSKTANPWEIFIKTLQYIMGGILIILIISIIAATFIAYVSYRPIINITQLFSQSEEQTSPLAIREISGEMSYITENILKNINKSREMEKELENRVILLRKAMFTALQVQINPHFIYNTLENINWLAVKLSGSENMVSSSLLALARLMRYSLETGGYLVSVSEEIKHAKEYVELLELRYPGLFEVHWDFDSILCNAEIIRLTFQPVLENAVQHGIRPKREKGNIWVCGEYKNDAICISITDDGVGMSHEEMEKLNREFSEEYLLDSGHVGLRNVNQRLKIVFGDSYGLKLESPGDLPRGLRVTITLPGHTGRVDSE